MKRKKPEAQSAEEAVKSQPTQEYKINFFRERRVLDKVFLSTDMASWTLLTQEEYQELQENKLSPALFEKLEAVGIILTEQNKEWVKQQYRKNYWHVLTGASLHIIVPTLRCNHTCNYCYANRVPENCQGYDMTLETATAVVDFIFQSPARSMVIEFTGGEPFLNFPVLKHIVTYAKELNKSYKKKIYFALVSNGTLWDEEKVQWARQAGVGLCVSLDGPAEVHNSNRRYLDGGATYDDVMKAIELHKRINNGRPPNALPVITRKSLENWKGIVDEYVGLGLKTMRFKYVTFFGFAEKLWNQVGYQPDEFVSAWKKTFDYILELRQKGVNITEGMSEVVIQKLLLMKDVGFCELQVPCGAARGQILYHYNGDIYPCDESRIFPELKIGNVHQNTYKEVQTHSTVTAFFNMSTNLNLKCDSCAYYAFCGLCPLQAYSERRNIRPRVPGDMKGEIHKELFNYVLEKLARGGPDAESIIEISKLAKKQQAEDAALARLQGTQGTR